MLKKAIALIGLTLSISANAATYYVDRVIGEGSVTGYIETDGTIGSLNDTNFTDWQLTLTSPDLFGGSPQSLNFGTNTILVMGAGASATTTDLLFDFDAVDAVFLIQDPGTSNYPFWGLGTLDACALDCLGEYIGWGPDMSGPAEAIAQSGVVSFGNTVPIPAAAWLFGSALLGLGAIKRRKAA